MGYFNSERVLLYNIKAVCSLDQDSALSMKKVLESSKRMDQPNTTKNVNICLTLRDGSFYAYSPVSLSIHCYTTVVPALMALTSSNRGFTAGHPTGHL